MNHDIPEHLRESINSWATDGDGFCDCGTRIGRWTSWTDNNPARRFIGCRNYKDKARTCRKFDWKDEELTDYYKGVILRLKDKANRVEEYEQRMTMRALKVMEVTHELSAIHARAEHLETEVEALKVMKHEIESENGRLKEKNARLKARVSGLQVRVSKGEGKEQVYKAVIVFLVAVIVVIGLLKANVAMNMKMLPK